MTLFSLLTSLAAVGVIVTISQSLDRVLKQDELNFMLCGGQQQQQQQQLQAQCMCRFGVSLKVLCLPLTLEEKRMASDHSHVERFKVSHARLLWAL